MLALLATQLGSLISPAYACGCGAMIPDGRSRIGVGQESSVLRWDGGTEQIVMRFTVSGDAHRAAWIMPVPGRATVELGNPALFDDLARLTRPEQRTRTYFWPREGDWPFDGHGDGVGGAAPSAGAPQVGVVGREQLGDFDVARLTATDPQALRGWLKDNGFELPDGLATELKPYVDQKWEYVAVRLAPKDKGRTLGGDLDPLRIRFASDRLVYPMRLSRLAKSPQSLGLYVLAEHRMEPGSAIGGSAPEVSFAGRIDPQSDPRSDPKSEAALAELTGGKPVFLTAIDQRFPQPARINGDHELRAAAADTPFRRVVYTDRLLTADDGTPVWLLTLLGAAVAVAAAGLVVALGVRRRRRNAVRARA
ncbi:DUF2330 domain-containing protein [Streptomyces sp. NPDC002138]|uniref:DUF2330 domain-containing protein n=1 Tax=Streptomyces sp. NPDC002138 TaxID=3154410 RepID=UPI0033232353